MRNKMGEGRKKGGKGSKAKIVGLHVLMCVLTFCLCVLAPSLTTSAPERPPQKNIVQRIKLLENSLGFRRTKSFARSSDKPVADYRCYYTGKLELPDSYDRLRLQPGTKDGCSLDANQYDVFFYPVEAVPFRKTPVTASLARESMERFLVVIPHEDYHESRQLRRLPATLSEAASTLMGMITAREVARENFGADSEVYRNLAREPELFLRKAEIVNRYFAQLSDLYARVRSGEVAAPEALAEKASLFQDALQVCQAIEPNPKSFNKCLSAYNNAGLAFDRTYTRYYPLMYELYRANQEDLKMTNEALKQALNTNSETAAVQRLRDLAEPVSEHVLPNHSSETNMASPPPPQIPPAK